MGSSSIRGILLLAAAAFVGFAASSSAQVFPGSQVYAGPGPVDAAVGDLNGDGKPDLAVVSFDVTLATLLANPNQGFGPAQLHSYGGTQSGAVSVALADFNGDGKLDFGIDVSSSGNLVFVPGDGAGGVAQATTLNAGSGASGLSFVDLNGDGKLDALFARSNFGQVGVWLGSGVGPYGAKLSFPSAGSSRAVVAGDLNGDGRLDLVVASDQVPSAISVLLGMPGVHGSLAFAPHVDTPLTGGPADLALGDFDNDGKLDVVTANTVGQSMSFLLGNGAGGFGAPSTASFPFQSKEVRLADLNGDANADAVLTSSGGHVTVMLGTGLGVFFAPVTYDMAGAEGATPADLDGNGRDDLVVPFNTSGPSGVGLSIWAPDPSGAIATPKLYSLVNLSGPTDVALGDVNGDGHLDAVTVTNFGFPPILSGDLEVLLGTPSGLFAAPVQANIAPHFRVCLADLTLDGKLDAITVLFTLSTLEVLTGNGAGGFSLAMTAPAASLPFDVGAADLNADGLPDVFTSDGSGNTVTLYFGNGAGGFLGTTALATGGFPLEANAGDLNGDGVLDIVSANNAASGISVLLGLGGGAFAPAVSYLGGTSTNGLRLDDLDGDGDLDVAVASASDFVFVFLGNGAGAFTGPSTYGFPSQSLVRAVNVCDVDGDGRRDIVAGTLGNAAVGVLRGVGGGNFAPPNLYPAGGAVQFGLTMGDLDADGRPDVVAIAGTKLSILRNQLSTPAGTAPYGAGTPGCSGILGLTANKPPKVGEATYGYICTNAPRGALGLGFATDIQDAAGSDPFSLGITLHVGFLGASQLIAYDLLSDSTGTAFAPAPIPNFPFLVGSNFYVQTLWLEALAQGEACGPSPFHLSTSSAVHITVQQ